jgi:hypothetical protein
MGAEGAVASPIISGSVWKLTLFTYEVARISGAGHLGSEGCPVL